MGLKTVRDKLHDGDESRRRNATYVMYGAWSGALALTVAQLSGVDHRWLDAPIVLLTGAALTAGQIRIRLKMTDAIIGAFQVGMKSAELTEENALLGDAMERNH